MLCSLASHFFRVDSLPHTVMLRASRDCLAPSSVSMLRSCEQSFPKELCPVSHALNFFCERSRGFAYALSSSDVQRDNLVSLKTSFLLAINDMQERERVKIHGARNLLSVTCLPSVHRIFHVQPLCDHYRVEIPWRPALTKMCLCPIYVPDSPLAVFAMLCVPSVTRASLLRVR
jgi:hypothetical protein